VEAIHRGADAGSSACDALKPSGRGDYWAWPGDRLLDQPSRDGCAANLQRASRAARSMLLRHWLEQELW